LLFCKPQAIQVWVHSCIVLVGVAPQTRSLRVNLSRSVELSNKKAASFESKKRHLCVG